MTADRNTAESREAAWGDLYEKDAKTAIREVTMTNRAMVAGIAETILEAGDDLTGNALLNAVRCCDEFPECSHVLDWMDTLDAS